MRTKPSKKNPEGKPVYGLWKCHVCRKQFTVRVGSIFEDSPIALGKFIGRRNKAPYCYGPRNRRRIGATSTQIATRLAIPAIIRGSRQSAGGDTANEGIEAPTEIPSCGKAEA